MKNVMLTLLDATTLRDVESTVAGVLAAFRQIVGREATRAEIADLREAVERAHARRLPETK